MGKETVRLTDLNGNIIYPESGQSDTNYIKLADGTLIKWGKAKIVAGSYAAIPNTDPKFRTDIQHTVIANVDYQNYSTLGLLCVTQPQTSGQDNVYVRKGDGNQLSDADIEKGYINYMLIGRWK